MEHPVDAFLQGIELIPLSGYESFCGFPQNNTALAGRIEDLRLLVPEELLRQQVQHFVCDVRRSKNLVVRQIGEAGKHIRFIEPLIN